MPLASRSIPPHGAFPQELVDLVIDELADAYENNPLHSSPCTDAYKALHACALVSKKCAVYSRMHLFRHVEIQVLEGRPTLPLPVSIQPYIKELGILCSPQLFAGCWPTQVASTLDFLKGFSAAPINRLGIAGGVLVNQRVYIQEFIDAHSATLRIVDFRSCSVSAHNIADIMLGHSCLKHFYLIDCKTQSLPPPITDTPYSGTCSKAAELELLVTVDDCYEGLAPIVAILARFPNRISRLDVDHLMMGGRATSATNELIRVNVNVLSSLQVRLLAGTFEFTRKMMLLLLIVIQPRRRAGELRRARRPVQS